MSNAGYSGYRSCIVEEVTPTPAVQTFAERILKHQLRFGAGSPHGANEQGPELKQFLRLELFGRSGPFARLQSERRPPVQDRASVSLKLLLWESFTSRCYMHLVHQLCLAKKRSCHSAGVSNCLLQTRLLHLLARTNAEVVPK